MNCARPPSSGQDHVDTRMESRANIGLLAFERFFIEAACNDQKSAQEYENLHDDLREFDQRMRGSFKRRLAIPGAAKPARRPV